VTRPDIYEQTPGANQHYHETLAQKLFTSDKPPSKRIGHSGRGQLNSAGLGRIKIYSQAMPCQAGYRPSVSVWLAWCGPRGRDTLQTQLKHTPSSRATGHRKVSVDFYDDFQSWHWETRQSGVCLTNSQGCFAARPDNTRHVQFSIEDIAKSSCFFFELFGLISID